MTYRKAAISQRSDGQYQRTIGKVFNSRGQLKPKRFLLGTDLRKAERANTLLEQLWDQLVDDFEQQRQAHLAFFDNTMRREEGPLLWGSGQPHIPTRREELTDAPVHWGGWNGDLLQLADAARRGTTTATIAKYPEETDSAYAARLHELGQRFSGFCIIPPDADRPAAERGRQSHSEAVEYAQKISAFFQADRSAQIARIPLEAGQGGTLYQALDQYAERERNNGNESGKTEAANALRLKDSIEDMNLSSLSYSALERLRDYWAARPEAKLRGGKPAGRRIAISTVCNHLDTARRFVRWLDRHDQYAWELGRHDLDALKVNTRQLRTEAETADLRQGVECFNVDQLTTIWQYATDFQRLLVLLSLNAAMSHAELRTLRWDEMDDDPLTIRRVRYKSGVYGEFQLWPETAKALDWWKRVRPPQGDLVLMTADHSAYTRQRLANTWAGLQRQVERELGEPVSWWLPLKHLRKTAAQLVRQASDGEIAGVFLSHGQPVQSDELSDVYSNRPFDKVASALMQVRCRLKPMFDSVDNAFTSSAVGIRRASKRAAKKKTTKSGSSKKKK